MMCILHRPHSAQGLPAAGCSPDEAERLAREAGLAPPLLAKPLWADGRNGAHEIALLLDDTGLRQLCSCRAPTGVALPVTLQQYVDHGACLYKVPVLPPLLLSLLVAEPGEGRAWTRSAAPLGCSLERAGPARLPSAPDAQVYVLGPITVVARRPSLQLPVQVCFTWPLAQQPAFLTLAAHPLQDPVRRVCSRPAIWGPAEHSAAQEKDVQERCGSVVTLKRVSAFHSETFRGEAPEGDPPQWLVEVRGPLPWPTCSGQL